MKKIMISIAIVIVGIFLASCVAETTDTFSQAPMEGAKAEIMVQHKGDKVTKASAKATFDNETLQIMNEAAAKQVVKAFGQASNLKDTKMTYSKKETIITYEAPAGSIKIGSSFKEGEKQLIDLGFNKN